MGSGKDLAFLI